MREFFKRVSAFEPAMVRAVLSALVVVLGTVGLEFAPIADKIDTAWVALFAILPILQGLLTRLAVTPNAKVEDPDHEGVSVWIAQRISASLGALAAHNRACICWGMRPCSSPRSRLCLVSTSRLLQ